MSLHATEHNFTGATTPISSYDYTKTNLGTLMVQKSGLLPEDNFAGPLPVGIARPMEESTPVPMMYPHIITYDATTDWVFMLENTVNAAKRIFLYEYDKVNGTYTRNGFITATTQNGTNIARGFRALRYLHTTGTVSVAAPTSVYATGTITMAVTGVITGSGTTFTINHVGMMIGFGSTDVTKINCWYPIITFASATSITVSGASSAMAAGTVFVIASCTVTCSNNVFTTELIASNTNSTSVAGGGGPRIGFGSTNPVDIKNWYQIGKITSDTTLNLNTSPGVVAAGTPYVIEELRFVMVMTNTTTTNGGIFILKGASFLNFITAGTTFPAIASAIDNQRGVYWLCDGGAGAVTNITANGCAIEAEINKQTHFAYVLNGGGTSSAIIYKYNLRANNTVVAGKMQLAGANIVITGAQTVTGTIPNAAVNNGIITTLLHGPGANNPYFYFVTTTRLYCAAVSAITSGNLTFINTADARQEIPPGGIITFPATGNMMNIQNMDSIDRLLITTYGSGAGYRQYVTRYPEGNSTYNVPFDHIFGVNDKQQDQSFLSSQAAVHFNTCSQILSADVNNGVVHISRNGTTAVYNQLYALPFGAHQTYAYTTTPANHQRIITPSIDTTGCIKYDQVLVLDDKYLGSGEMHLTPEPYQVYYRTTDITIDATSSWTLVSEDGDLSAVTPANAIQFMFEFFTIGKTCIPARLLKVVVTYEDGSTDSHYQLSSTLSDVTNKRFAWRFFNSFNDTVPNLKIELFNADTGASLLTDTTLASANGTWQKSINGGGNWVAYDTTDKGNEATYIRYTPTSLADNIIVRALLTQN